MTRTSRLCRSVLALVPVLLFAGAPLGCASRPTIVAAKPESSTAAETEAKIRAALAGGQRTDKERARDAYRHPLETLSFFELRDNMTVLELWPGGGWYAAVLAPVLEGRGKLIDTSFDPNGDPKSYETIESRDFLKRMSENRDAFGKVAIQTIHSDAAAIDLGPEGSVDLVLTFRSVHNWLDDGYATKVFAAVFKVLKPGGVFGIVEHRASQATPEELLKGNGYVPQAFVVKLGADAGFELVSTSEINANPKDTKDYDQGVWALPPTFANKDVDREKYAAIGESDRMTVKLQKPAR